MFKVPFELDHFFGKHIKSVVAGHVEFYYLIASLHKKKIPRNLVNFETF